MLHVLLESGGRIAPRRTGWTAASVLVHASLISLAVAATVADAPRVLREPMSPERAFYISPRVAPRENGSASSTLIPATIPRVPIVHFPAIPVFDPGASIENIGPLTIGPTTNPVAGGDPSAGTPGGVHDARHVERMVMARPDNPQPEYPRQLRSSGLEGDVYVRFIVDTTGRVELPSIQVVQSSHALFGDAVRRWLARTRYVPAEAGRDRVRQLVEQRVGFTLQR